MNGRNPKKPWSLRQVGIYQQRRGLDARSVWIFVQPPESLYRQLNGNAAGLSKQGFNRRDSDILLHLAALSATQRNWDQYIAYLRNELSELVSLIGNWFFVMRGSNACEIGGQSMLLSSWSR